MSCPRCRRGSGAPTWRLVSTLLALVVLTGCGKGSSPEAGGGPPAMGVEIQVLDLHPVERTTEYIATIKSRRSTTIKPQVEGFIRRIAVKSGDTVREGALLVDIDSGQQRAAVASLESLRAARAADLDFATQQAARQKTRFEAGAASAQELEWAETTRRSAAAQLEAIEEQIEEQRVGLAYYRVTAPASGIVGDIPVRVGDRVTESSELTTIDGAEGLEMYVHVPVRMAADLREGLRLRLLDDQGELITETQVDFVSRQVDDLTQTVLVKAPVPAGMPLRHEQFVRAELVWSADPGLTVPVTAVSRIGGSHFAYVAQDEQGKTVARQRALRVGPIVGNEYVLLSGLEPGDRLIVSGVQKIGDGVPVDPRPAAAGPVMPPAAPAARG